MLSIEGGGTEGGTKDGIEGSAEGGGSEGGGTGGGASEGLCDSGSGACFFAFSSRWWMLARGMAAKYANTEHNTLEKYKKHCPGFVSAHQY